MSVLAAVDGLYEDLDKILTIEAIAEEHRPETETPDRDQ